MIVTREVTFVIPINMTAKTGNGICRDDSFNSEELPDIEGSWLKARKISTGIIRALTKPMGSRMKTLNSIEVSVHSPFGN